MLTLKNASREDIENGKNWKNHRKPLLEPFFGRVSIWNFTENNLNDFSKINYGSCPTEKILKILVKLKIHMKTPSYTCLRL